jgi:hypothetical protein
MFAVTGTNDMTRRTNNVEYVKIPDDTNLAVRYNKWSLFKTVTVITFSLFVIVIVLIAATSAYNSYVTPVRAGCNLMIDFKNSCADVRKEITRRVDGQPNSWHDPHNNGNYAFAPKNSKEKFSLERKSGTGSKTVYIDIIEFIFENSPDENSCHVVASSNSQVFSLLDMGTNFCNMNNLYSSDKECRPFEVLEYTYSVGKCTDSTLKKCYTI